jgi:phospholipid/cholesterol/gamma-HCH transport system permease protein
VSHLDHPDQPLLAWHTLALGATLLLAAEAAHGGEIALEGGPAAAATLIERLRRIPKPAPPAPPPAFSLARLARQGLTAAANGIAFLGEAVVALFRLPARRRQLRLADIVRTADAAGFRAVPLVLMLGFLIGVILAFQSAVPLQRFGAEIYVANLVGVALTRELGPLLTAVILAGRTGSAFAAEIGTMKVNEELAALTTLGLDTMTMLVLPRLFAALLVMPALILLLDIAGLLGMGVVMGGFGYVPTVVAQQVVQTTSLGDLAGGLAKGLVFGAAIAAIGCRAGMDAGIGPRAVGVAATGAVVGGIVSMVILDGVFAVLFYAAGW